MARTTRQTPPPPAQTWWQALSFKRTAAEVSAVLVVIGATYGFVQYVEVKPLQRQLAEAQAGACDAKAAAMSLMLSLLPGESRTLFDGALTIANLTPAQDDAKVRLRIAPLGAATVDKLQPVPGDRFLVQVPGRGRYAVYLRSSSAQFVELSILRQP
ncbi:hypothetical protein NG829_03760 [Xanthomonas sacchari]|uniref:hypothetical protein n=1 Tax=Xanthomonas sacchari TaxID=56458 RepID=UPI00225E14BA|nr:hypothetical protein [Xanthomonas sacchari]UYK81443.1 hypothetical protein NG829_03760 [Xanthomonas sacchari]